MSTIKESKTTIFTLAFGRAVKLSSLTKKQVAEKTGIFAGRISEYALGKTDPSFANILKIANCFGYGLTEFFALGEHQPPTEPPVLSTEREIELLRKIEDLSALLGKKDRRIEELEKRLAEAEAASGPISAWPPQAAASLSDEEQ
jgi:transcriptional regulator with XRE-family HTH domain